MRYFLDTEFNEFGGELISLALVNEDGQSFYGVVPCRKPKPWVAENVIPHLMSAPTVDVFTHRDYLAEAMLLFLEERPAATKTIVADWPDDIRYFCELLISGPGELTEPKPKGMQFDWMRVDAYPTTLKGAIQHNAYWDAMALRQKVMFG